MKTDTELKHLINKCIYLLGGIIVACLCGFWIHDCNKFAPPETCHPSVEIITAGNDSKHCSIGAEMTTRLLDPDPNPNNYRDKVLYTCTCPQPTTTKP